MNSLKRSIWFQIITLVVLSASSVSSKAVQPKETISFTKLAHAGTTVFFANSGAADQTGLLFIHGTPGSWEAFQWYLSNPDLQKDYFMVSIDRPGWGGSMIDVDFDVSSFSIHSAAIGAIFDQFPDKKWILVGHSLGASIAPQIALDYPDRVSGLLLLAGSLSPRLGSPRWYNRVANTWIVSKLLGKSIGKSYREIMLLRSQLAALDIRVKRSKIDADVIILQGKKDKLVSPKNSQYALKNWSEHFSSIAVVELEGEGHFLPWRQSSLVVELIEELTQQQNEK